ncbi:unnamed protein product [Amoebophrya sp. A25]|nr:unnamed protein product [Amoebophrya sp. A25]|eukprot:GSA25T00012145001.1
MSAAFDKFEASSSNTSSRVGKDNIMNDKKILILQEEAVVSSSILEDDGGGWDFSDEEPGAVKASGLPAQANGKSSASERRDGLDESNYKDGLQLQVQPFNSHIPSTSQMDDVAAHHQSLGARKDGGAESSRLNMKMTTSTEHEQEAGKGLLNNGAAFTQKQLEPDLAANAHKFAAEVEAIAEDDLPWDDVFDDPVEGRGDESKKTDHATSTPPAREQERLGVRPPQQATRNSPGTSTAATMFDRIAGNTKTSADDVGSVAAKIGGVFGNFVTQIAARAGEGTLVARNDGMSDPSLADEAFPDVESAIQAQYLKLSVLSKTCAHVSVSAAVLEPLSMEDEEKNEVHRSDMGLGASVPSSSRMNPYVELLSAVSLLQQCQEYIGPSSELFARYHALLLRFVERAERRHLHAGPGGSSSGGAPEARAVVSQHETSAAVGRTMPLQVEEEEDIDLTPQLSDVKDLAQGFFSAAVSLAQEVTTNVVANVAATTITPGGDHNNFQQMMTGGEGGLFSTTDEEDFLMMLPELRPLLHDLFFQEICVLCPPESLYMLCAAVDDANSRLIQACGVTPSPLALIGLLQFHSSVTEQHEKVLDKHGQQEQEVEQLRSTTLVLPYLTAPRDIVRVIRDCPPSVFPAVRRRIAMLIEGGRMEGHRQMFASDLRKREFRDACFDAFANLYPRTGVSGGAGAKNRSVAHLLSTAPGEAFVTLLEQIAKQRGLSSEEMLDVMTT